MKVTKEMLPDARWKPVEETDARPVIEVFVIQMPYHSLRVATLRKWPGAWWHMGRKVWCIPVTKDGTELLKGWGHNAS